MSHYVCCSDWHCIAFQFVFYLGTLIESLVKTNKTCDLVKKNKKKTGLSETLKKSTQKKRTRNRKVLPVKTQLSDDRFPRVKANWIFRKCMGLSGSEVCTYICQQQQQQQKSLFFFPFKVCDLLPTAPSHLESSCLLNFFFVSPQALHASRSSSLIAISSRGWGFVQREEEVSVALGRKWCGISGGAIGWWMKVKHWPVVLSRSWGLHVSLGAQTRCIDRATAPSPAQIQPAVLGFFSGL